MRRDLGRPVRLARPSGTVLLLGIGLGLSLSPVQAAAQLTGVGPITWGSTRADVEHLWGRPTQATGPSATGVVSLVYPAVSVYGTMARVVLTVRRDQGLSEAVVFVPLPAATAVACRSTFARLVPLVGRQLGPKVNARVTDETRDPDAGPLCGLAERHATLSAEWVDLTGATAVLSVAPEFDAVMLVLDAPTYAGPGAPPP
jgi:hypothetical protein